MAYIYLAIAIISEIFATTMLKDTAIIYAIWSGVGIVGIAILGWIIHKQILDAPAIIGIALILCGVLIIKIFSKTVA